MSEEEKLWEPEADGKFSPVLPMRVFSLHPQDDKPGKVWLVIADDGEKNRMDVYGIADSLARGEILRMEIERATGATVLLVPVPMLEHVNFEKTAGRLLN